ncbi:MAG: prepilin-type cleavage/methylation domain-containing protein [Betaproteobacteria bacterium]|nr:prepilin-type cleavage/methylation domain-containing protein [Betaproteobacteria bacterium]
MTARRHHTLGFSLVELAVAIFIIALLLGAVLVPLVTQIEQRQIAETQKAMDDIREALLGFAAANRYLPCPAVSATNGLEDRAAGACTAGKRQGFLPWETLGVPRLDAWGRLYRYSVTPNFTLEPPFSFTGTTGPDITIRTRNAAGTLVNLTPAPSNQIVPVVVISHGKNGYGGSNADGIAQALPGGWPANNTDENTNANGTISFVSRSAQAAGAAGAGGEFDDQVLWISRWVLLSRMVAAGKLP